jgi:hypothetical protein
MTNKKRPLRILIASPGDVNEERQAIRDVIKNINYWAIFANIEFSTIDWENYSYPSIGDYPQDALNNQFKGKYDILIGVFWSRIGTKTPNYESGSIEEIEIAIDRYKKQRNVNVMLYFKTEHVPEGQIDNEQIKKLNEFKSNLSKRGVFYWDFQNTGDFKNYISQHLALLVQHKYWINSKEKINIDFIANQESEIYNSPSESFKDAVDQRSSVHEIISLLAIFHSKESSQLNIVNEKLTELLTLPKSKSVFNDIKNVMDESTLRIREQASILDKELKDIKIYFIKMFNAYSNSILLSDDLNRKERKELVKSIFSLIELKSSYLNIIGEVDKSIKLHKLEIKDNRFPAYSRALKEYLRIKILYRNIFKDSIYLMDELGESTKKLI